MTSTTKANIITALILISLGFVARLLPHPPNFAPISAIALFGALYLPKRTAIFLPVTAMFVSDIFIGFYNPKIMIAVYIGFVIAGLIGLAIRKRKKFRTILGGTVLGSIVFFLLTNGAVWGFGTMYAKSIAGLIECYTMALPFFRNSLLGDLFYVSILVGSYEGVLYFIKNNRLIAEAVD